jgi:uncharacterized surface protein with fasciclin (FAS1) repeats
MKAHAIIIGFLVVVLPAAVIGGSYSKTGSTMTSGSMDVVDMAAHTGQFNTLVAAIKAADLEKVLRGEGPFTVLAPTDEAFAKLPAGTVEDLLKPENKEKLQAILTYHVIPGRVYAKDVMGMQSGKTVNGEEVSFRTEGGSVYADDAMITQTDIEASNGVIHIIDTVIMP